MAGRRSVKSRETKWAKALASLLVSLRVPPNAISLVAIVFALLACAGFLLSGKVLGGGQRLVWLLVAAAAIQLRLLCNMLDGMVAVEGRMGSKTGELYNDLPDRIADAIIFVPVGYAIGIPELGWLAGILAVMTAYVRVLGGSMGVPQDFRGPMAKAHRMATLTIGAIADGIAGLYNWRGRLLLLALALIIVGTIITMARRTARMVRELNAR